MKAVIVPLRRIEVIRRYYASLQSTAPRYFSPDRTEEGIHGVRYRGRSILFTVASMIIVVNSVLGGATVTLFFALVVGLTIPLAVAIGVLLGAVLLLVSLWHEYRRLSPLIVKTDVVAQQAPDLA